MKKRVISICLLVFLLFASRLPFWQSVGKKQVAGIESNTIGALLSEEIDEAKKVLNDAGYDVILEGIDDFDDDRESLDMATTVINAIDAGEINGDDFAKEIIAYLSETNEELLNNFLESHSFLD